jgi:hypothetical protein
LVILVWIAVVTFFFTGAAFLAAFFSAFFGAFLAAFLVAMLFSTFPKNF